jgi:hypothetical protein
MLMKLGKGAQMLMNVGADLHSRSTPRRLVNCARFLDNQKAPQLVVSCRGAMVQRLARGPFKAEIRVRFPLALPSV